MSVTLSDFLPVNTWKFYEDGIIPGKSGYSEFIPARLMDMSTGREYLDESKSTIRKKCGLLILGTLPLHSLAAILSIANKILKLISFYHFWSNKEDEEEFSFKARLKDAGEDFVKIIASPIAVVGLELAAIYGVFRPYDGRKLYATIERAMNGEDDFPLFAKSIVVENVKRAWQGKFMLAPCFQPKAKRHFFGGDIHEKDAY